MAVQRCPDWLRRHRVFGRRAAFLTHDRDLLRQSHQVYDTQEQGSLVGPDHGLHLL